MIIDKEQISNVFLLEGKSFDTWKYIVNLLKLNFDIDLNNENIDISVVDCRDIDVKHLRELLSSTLMKPRGNYKVYIMNNGENLTAIMQNAMLKTLEEPPDYAFFGILCENAGGILPTLRSRCNYVYVNQTQDEDLDSDNYFVKIIEHIYCEELGLAFQELKGLSKREDAVRFLENFLRYMDTGKGRALKNFEDTKYEIAKIVEEARLLVIGNCNCSASLDAMVLNIVEVLSGNSSWN